MRAQAKRQIVALLLIMTALLMGLLPMGSFSARAEESDPQYGYFNPEEFSEELDQEFLERHARTNLTAAGSNAPAITVLT